MKMLRSIGKWTVRQAQGLSRLLAVAWSALAAAVRPQFWPSPVRNVLARQILFTGYEASRFISLIAVLVGLAVVLQAQVALAKLGQSSLLGPILVMVIIREIGPLLTNFIVIGRSGTAMTTELANMKVNGEVELLDAQGLDPFLYLVLPRVLGAALSIFCLTVIFITVSFLSGFFSGMLLGANTGNPEAFIRSIFGAVSKADVFNLILKSFVPGLLMGSICCIEGLSVGAAITEVPQAATRAVVKSTAALFITSALVSLVTYL
ncbi:MAG: ABC transporter permease [Kiritimatiellae bacterium]|nr:ABC transporter permease [Kiritimatiellia bacterium]